MSNNTWYTGSVNTEINLSIPIKMPCKGKCVDCKGGLFECMSKEVKELPCKHYRHSSCIVLLHEEAEEGEEPYCLRCGRKIPRDWLKKTVDEIEEQTKNR